MSMGDKQTPQPQGKLANTLANSETHCSKTDYSSPAFLENSEEERLNCTPSIGEAMTMAVLTNAQRVT